MNLVAVAELANESVRAPDFFPAKAHGTPPVSPCASRASPVSTETNLPQISTPSQRQDDFL
jgi:hypothetical protein